MTAYAFIRNGVVVNTIEWDGDPSYPIPKDVTLIPIEKMKQDPVFYESPLCQKGMIYDAKAATFTLTEDQKKELVISRLKDPTIEIDPVKDVPAELIPDKPPVKDPPPSDAAADPDPVAADPGPAMLP